MKRPSTFHDRGFNRAYRYENYELNAQSVSYILCRRFGVEREQPDAPHLPALFRGCGVEARQEALKGIQGMSRQIGGAIDKTLSPPQRAAPSRSGGARYPVQDQAARDMGLRLLESCQQVNVYGSELTEGMLAEIGHTSKLGIPVTSEQQARIPAKKHSAQKRKEAR